VLRKASVLPITFLGGGSVGDGGGGGFDSVVGSVRGVTGNVGGCCGVTGGAGGGAGRSLFGVACGGMGGKSCRPTLANPYLTTHPGTPCLDSFPRPVVFRVLLLEVREYVLGAASGPEYQ